MQNSLGVWSSLIFEHVLYLVYTSTRAIKFITQNLISRTGCSAKSAMDARSQDLIGSLDIGFLQLQVCKVCLHLFTPSAQD